MIGRKWTKEKYNTGERRKEKGEGEKQKAKGKGEKERRGGQRRAERRGDRREMGSGEARRGERAILEHSQANHSHCNMSNLPHNTLNCHVRSNTST